MNSLWRRSGEIVLKGADNKPTLLCCPCVSQTQEEITDHTEWVTVILTVCSVYCLKEGHHIICALQQEIILLSNPLTSLNSCFAVKYFMIYFPVTVSKCVKLPHHYRTKWQGKSQRPIPQHLSTPEVHYWFSRPPDTLHSSSDLWQWAQRGGNRGVHHGHRLWRDPRAPLQGLRGE